MIMDAKKSAMLLAAAAGGASDLNTRFLTLPNIGPPSVERSVSTYQGLFPLSTTTGHSRVRLPNVR
jgi:hypothetical protein